MNHSVQEYSPIFDFETDASAVVLKDGTAEVVIDGTTYSGLTQVRLEYFPTPGVIYHASFSDVPVQAVFLAMTDSGIQSFSCDGRTVKGFFVNIGGEADNKTLNLRWVPAHEPVEALGDESSMMKYAVLHCINFVDFHGTSSTFEQRGDRNYRIAILELKNTAWQLEIKSLTSTSEAIKTLRARGGYKITHAARLNKFDGTSFSGAEAKEFLSMLGYFLSFTKGAWSNPICPVGFDATGNRSWETWSSPKESWKIPPTWFAVHASKQLADLFGLFSKKWETYRWQDALREVIYWYLNANDSSRGIDAGIILAQAAIERLSFEYAVQEKKLLTTKGFQDIWASDKFRLLFSSLGIPLEIPQETPELKKLAVQFGWIDAPHALTEIRNSLVHPEHKRRGQFDSAIYEAWNLGLWCLEMSILAVCAYDGTCNNRVKHGWTGQSENVPWVENQGVQP